MWKLAITPVATVSKQTLNNPRDGNKRKLPANKNAFSQTLDDAVDKLRGKSRPT